MTRFGSIILCAALGSALLACGSNNTSGGTSTGGSSGTPTKNAIDLAKAQAEALIDGGASPFYKAPFTPKEFLWQNYINDTLPAALPQGATVVLYILHMPSADQASGLYTALLQESEYSGQTGTTNDWQPTSPRLGAESRIENTVTAWWVNFHQDVFYVEVMLTPSYGPPPDDTPDDVDLKNEAMRFAQAVASKI
jgi:hypothetical protein